MQGHELNPGNPPEIPKKFHFIWVGGPIPKDYYLNILRLADAAKKNGFEVNLWVDNEKNIQFKTKTSDYDKDKKDEEKKDYVEGLSSDIPKPNFKIRNINELKPKMEADPFYKEHPERIKAYWNAVDRERVGLKNLAAAADILRVEILRQEGGYYTDTDTVFNVNANTVLKADTPPFGFLFHGNKRMGSKENVSFGGTNDLIASLPNHPILQDMTLTIMDNYQKLDTFKTSEELSLNKRDLKILQIIRIYDLYRTPEFKDSLQQLNDADKNILNLIKKYETTDKAKLADSIDLNDSNIETLQIVALYKYLLKAIEDNRFDNLRTWTVKIRALLQTDNLFDKLKNEQNSLFKKFREDELFFLFDEITRLVQNKTKQQSDEKTLMDKKREHKDKYPEQSADDRWGLTLKMTGPTVLCNSVSKYYKEYYKKASNAGFTDEEEERSLRRAREFFGEDVKDEVPDKKSAGDIIPPTNFCFGHKDRNREHPYGIKVEFAGMVCTARSEQSWAKKPKLTSFDDSAISYSSISQISTQLGIPSSALVNTTKENKNSLVQNEPKALDANTEATVRQTPTHPVNNTKEKVEPTNDSQSEPETKDTPKPF